MLQKSRQMAFDLSRQVPHVRPLLFSGDRLYCSQGNQILATSDAGRTFQHVCTLSVSRSQRAASWSVLARRVLRFDVSRMCELAGGSRAYVAHGGVFVQRPFERTATCTMRVQRGSRPVSLATHPNGDVVFGEYWSNPKREAVNIFGSSDGGQTWRIVHTFDRGTIRHVHEIHYDRFEDCYWLGTGDYGTENRLIRASSDFSSVKTVRCGGQHNRFFSLQIFKDSIVAATDTPLEQNSVMVINKTTGHARQAVEIDNACLSMCTVDDRVFVSTAAERSEVNDDRISHVWASDRSLNRWDKIHSRPVDLIDRIGRMPGLRNGFFQHARFIFPDGTNEGHDLVCYGLGLKGQHDSMMVFDTLQLAQETPVDLAKVA